jgi:hypothetical protein
MSQRKSVLYVSNITSTVSGVSLAEHILKSTGHLSTFLQGVKCDLVEAVKESEVVINQLTSERNDQTVWDSLFDMAVYVNRFCMCQI